MRKLLIAAALCTPLVAQMPHVKLLERPTLQAADNSHPLAEKARNAVRTLQLMKAAREELLRKKIVDAPPCAHGRLIKPAPTAGPQMIVGPPQAFQSNMPMAQSTPACDPNHR